MCRVPRAAEGAPMYGRRAMVNGKEDGDLGHRAVTAAILSVAEMALTVSLMIVPS